MAIDTTPRTPTPSLVPAPVGNDSEPPTGAAVTNDLHRDKVVNHPPHYKQNPEGIEVIQVTRHLNFNVGNAVKYLLRAGHKDDMLTDLEMAKWYINDEIERVKKLES